MAVIADAMWPLMWRRSTRTCEAWWCRFPRRVLGGYLVAEGAAWTHYAATKRRARAAPLPAREPADAEYGERFLSLARCDAREASNSLACARFVRHAFFGAPPEALSREAVAAWLQQHLGESARAEESLAVLEAALGPYAPNSDGIAGGSSPHANALYEDPPSFVYGEGRLEALYKPLPLRLYIEAQHLIARRRLAASGFAEHRDPQVAGLSFWVRRQSAGDVDEDPPLVVLHGYGRGLASPLFERFVAQLGRRSLVIVDCSWLLVTRVPTNGDLTRTPTVREIASAVAEFLYERRTLAGKHESVDIIGHSFGTAVASALARDLEERGAKRGRVPSPLVALEGLHEENAVAVRRVVLMDPMCFLPGITKQAQLLRRMPRDVVTELVAEASPGAGLQGPPTYKEVVNVVLKRPGPGTPDEVEADEASAALERRRWVIFQTYFFFYFIFRDLVYSWVNQRSLQGPEYLDRGFLRSLNQQGRLLTVLAETDSMIPAPLLRDDLSQEVPLDGPGGVVWLPTVGHGACQHRADVARRIKAFLAAA